SCPRRRARCRRARPISRPPRRAAVCTRSARARKSKDAWAALDNTKRKRPRARCPRPRTSHWVKSRGLVRSTRRSAAVRHLADEHLAQSAHQEHVLPGDDDLAAVLRGRDHPVRAAGKRRSRGNRQNETESFLHEDPPPIHFKNELRLEVISRSPGRRASAFG